VHSRILTTPAGCSYSRLRRLVLRMMSVGGVEAHIDCAVHDTVLRFHFDASADTSRSAASAARARVHSIRLSHQVACSALPHVGKGILLLRQRAQVLLVFVRTRATNGVYFAEFMSSDRISDLYRKYGPTIYSRCLRLLGDAGAAEDATQETFVRVHRHLVRAPSGDEAIAWIWRIATNLCLNEKRNAERRPRLADEGSEAPELRSRPLRDELHANRDLARRVVARADARDRVVAWLYHVDGLEQDEIAGVLGMSRRTVVNRLQSFARNARKFVRREAS
jgi:RNA polymerase sigma-70 factor (ECF subfamily)